MEKKRFLFSFRTKKGTASFSKRFLLVVVAILIFTTLAQLAITLTDVTLQRDVLPTIHTYDAAPIEIGFSDFSQDLIILDEPVIKYQWLSINNSENETIDMRLDLEDFEDAVPDLYLEEAIQVEIYTPQGNLIAFDEEVDLSVQPGEHLYLLLYSFSPVHKEVTCSPQQVGDLLPEQAVLIETDISLDILLQQECRVRIFHEGDVHHYSLTVSLDEFATRSIASIYYVEGEQELVIDEDGYITLPDEVSDE